MKKLFCLALALLCCLGLAACGTKAPVLPGGEQGGEADLFVVMPDGEREPEKLAYVGTLSPETLLEGLGELTGWRFDCASVTVSTVDRENGTSETIATVDLQDSCSLFHFDELVPFEEYLCNDYTDFVFAVLDSAHMTLSLNLGYTDIVFTANGKPLSLPELSYTFPEGGAYRGKDWHLSDMKALTQAPKGYRLFSMSCGMTAVYPDGFSIVSEQHSSVTFENTKDEALMRMTCYQQDSTYINPAQEAERLSYDFASVSRRESDADSFILIGKDAENVTIAYLAYFNQSNDLMNVVILQSMAGADLPADLVQAAAAHLRAYNK
ncbi:MAG: hypothetical protein IJP30_04065 [Clostridia bacterium]|nr:hypothetical protein [Clostridia bacterium]